MMASNTRLTEVCYVEPGVDFHELYVEPGVDFHELWDLQKCAM